MRGFKTDTAARQAFGAAYDSIPKSAFALIAFHLADLCSDDSAEMESIFRRLTEEAEALGYNGIMPEAHVRAIKKALG